MVKVVRVLVYIIMLSILVTIIIMFVVIIVVRQESIQNMELRLVQKLHPL